MKALAKGLQRQESRETNAKKFSRGAAGVEALVGSEFSQNAGNREPLLVYVHVPEPV